MDRREKQQIRSANDPRFHPLIDAADEASRELAMEELLVRDVTPLIRATLDGSWAMQTEDIEDVAATVTLRLLRRFRRIPFSRDDSIKDFREFVVSLTRNTLYDVLRARFPHRTRLKNRLRYALERDSRFTTWLQKGVTVAGLWMWKERSTICLNARLDKHQVTLQMLDRDDLAGAIEAVLHHFKKPVTLDDLIEIFGDLWGVVDEPSPNAAEVDSTVTPFRQFESRQHLANLWSEIRMLPPSQRIALLLNLRERDSFSAVALFLLVGTATFEEIAASVNMTTEELTAIWNDLPIDDLTIAARLGVTRQQVINLRKSARERLSRRMTMKDRWQP